jgi:outer membrane receptor protein involved in Fe transport
VRYNSHVAPFAGNQTQVSPRIRLNFFLDAQNTIFVYWGRTFMPTNIEDLRSITVASGAGDTTASATLPERDSFWEAAWIHRFLGGVTFKLDGYWKDSSPGTDDNTIPGSAITTTINQANSHTRGIEVALHVDPPDSPLSGYLNLAIAHGYANGPITGGFFQLAQPNTTFDFDHDQRISASANLVWTIGHGYISTTGIYGSGLTASVTPDATVPNDTGSKANGTYQPGANRYCTGLFCFNAAFKVPPSYIQQVAVGFTMSVGATYVRPEFFVDNVFDSHYLLKGAFYSGQAIGRPRTFNMKVKIGV